MKTIEREFIPVILGNDINTYSLARAFYEEYKTKSIVIGKYSSGPSSNSKIIDFYAEKNLDRQEKFMETIDTIASKYSSKKIIILGCGDSYAELIMKNKNTFKENVIAPYIEEELMNDLMKKSKFYEMCDKYDLEYPKTLIHTRNMGENFTLSFDFPIILKPSNSIAYWEHEFKGQKKVYKLTNMEDLKATINSIYTAGYDDSLIIQEFVPGEDSHLRIMICFSGKDKKVKLMSLAHVMLEEHTPHGLGNCALLMNEYNKELSEMIKNFLENIQYEGFSTFDIKYDYRDDKFKVLEVNLRQGRSNYYVTGAGYNLAKYVVEEYIYNNSMDFEIVNVENLWTVIPMQIAHKYVKDKNHIAKIKDLIRDGKVVNPLFLKGDNNIKRLLFLYKSHISQFIKFKKYFVR